MIPGVLRVASCEEELVRFAPCGQSVITASTDASHREHDMNRSIRLRRQVSAALLLAFTLHTTARAADPAAASAATASEASVGSLAAAGSVVVGGSLALLAVAGTAVVASVTVVGASTVMVLRGASDAATASVRVVGNASLAVGSVVDVVAVSTGCVLMSAGRIVAFVPNEVGRALVHQRPLASLR